MAVSARPSRLRRLAAGAPTPVLLAAGAGAGPVRTAVLAAADVELVASPRHATVLLVAGALPGAHLGPLAQVHDQLPGPRATVWATGRPAPLEGLPEPVVVGDAADVPAAVRRVHAELLADPDRGEPLVTPASHPVDWLGRGDFGQGGEGMMGGTPYGRPMAMPPTEDLRDGLALDALTVPLGPFLAWLPAGVRLDVVVQGDVIQQVDVEDAAGPGERWHGAPVEHAPAGDASLRELELGRARSHLAALAHLLWLHGLPALASRAARLATTIEPGVSEPVARLGRLLGRTRALDAATAGVGRLPPELVDALPSGPVTRAAGGAADARSHDPTYARLGFEVRSRREGDARARWRQWLDEAEQSVWLAGRADDERPAGAVRDTPHGVDPAATRRVLLAALPDLLVGLELGQAVTTLASLDAPDPAVATVASVSTP